MYRPSPLNATDSPNLVPSQFVQPCTGLEVPHRHRPIVGARDDVPPVAAQRHGSHPSWCPVSSCSRAPVWRSQHRHRPQFVQPCTGLEVPHRHRPIVGARDDVPPVAAQRHGTHPTWCPVSSCSRAPVWRSHTATVPSPEPETMYRPSPLNATELTPPWCPVSSCSRAPVWRSHTATVLSSEPETMYRPSPLNATELTQPWCPVSSCSRAPVWRSHTATVPSLEPETMYRPSPLNATEFTHLVPSQLVQPCTGLEVPHRHRPVVGARDDVPPVAAQRHGISPGRVSPDPGAQSVGSRAPVWRSHTATVPSWSPRRCTARRRSTPRNHPILVPSQFVQPCTGLEVPHRHRPIVGARDDVPPVAAQRHGSHPSWCPVSSCSRAPVWRSHTATVPSSEPETMYRPSPLKATEFTHLGAQSVRAAVHRSGGPTPPPSHRRSPRRCTARRRSRPRNSPHPGAR